MPSGTVKTQPAAGFSHQFTNFFWMVGKRSRNLDHCPTHEWSVIVLLATINKNLPKNCYSGKLETFKSQVLPQIKIKINNYFYVANYFRSRSTSANAGNEMTAAKTGSTWNLGCVIDTKKKSMEFMVEGVTSWVSHSITFTGHPLQS